MKTVHKLIVVIFTFLTLAVSAYAADDSPLFEAVKRGDKAAVEALLAKGADVNTKDTSSTGRGETPLHHAAFYGYAHICELLLAKGADLSAKDINGKTPTMWAAYKKNYDIMSYLEKQESLLMEREQRLKQASAHATGESLLYEAVKRGDKAEVEALLAKGADVNAKTNREWTPLHQALYFDRTEIAKLLLARMLEQARRNPRAAFVVLNEQLKDHPADKGNRRLIIKLASELKPAPAIPEEARKHFIEGTAIVKAAKNPAQQALAAQSFTEAVIIAPWWGDAYYNLGVAQELAEKYNEAEQAFNFYLLSNPGATEKREVQDRIYALSAKRKLLGAK
ncbi:MAG: ankyrin repeat domain-containing protein [Sulfuricaulis sp.]|uniref:ankyrin repeat domain-containing protein n=1 Tax=Sulfuricaulis sp. TaxID=2003553 RepID=UPI0025EAB2AB|nr:ankyrin repeat domain-containing protein [Sulfuricaulis sp.]MCR4346169.1 ankyrin repeat domain-containing protein [Sulfuricaulis sp.]